MPIPQRTIKELQSICGPRNVLTEFDERLVYESDAFPLARSTPGLVVFPTSTPVAANVLSCLDRAGIAFVPRGAGTSLAGGCLTADDAVCVSTAKMRRIIEMDIANECAVVEAGVVTQHISDAARAHDYHYAPDPSSQTTCTIGGNVANNAGGPHTLAHGVTANHVMGLTACLPSGEILRLGGRTRIRSGPDTVRLFCGSEGTFALITEVIVRLTRSAPAVRTILAVFDSMDDASGAVSTIIASGIVPAALEMMDDACLRIVDEAYGYGFPQAAAVLVIELEGIEVGLDDRLARIVEHCTAHHVKRIEHADNEADRALLWKARKTAFGALGRAAPSCITQDGVVPRSRLPEILRFVRTVAERRGLRVASNFHAGDGNIHPNFLFDARDPRQVAAVQAAGHDILAECVRLGGSISGEHGIGIEKIDAMRLMFNDRELAAQQALRRVFDPHERANSDKVFDTSEGAAMHDTGGGLRPQLIDLLGPEALSAPNQPLTISPADEDGFAATLWVCSDHGLRLTPTGRAADVLATPTRGGWLSTSRLDLLVTIAAADLTVTAQAGMSVAQLNAVAAEHGLTCPVDPAGPSTVTLGSLVAAGPCGPFARHYGPIADHLLAATLVTPAHGRLRSGAPTAKNVAGYDLHRLMVGSRGLFGVVTEVTLRLVPKPQACAVAIIETHGPGATAADLRRIVRGTTRPAMLEILDCQAAEDVGHTIAPQSMLLCVGYVGDNATVQWQVETVACDIEREVHTLCGTAALHLYEQLRDWPDLPADFKFEACARLERCAPLATFCQRAGIAVVARPGLGVVHGRGHGPLTREDALALRAVAGADSTTVFTTLPADSAIEQWPTLPGAPWLRRMKAMFDPDSILPTTGLGAGERA